MIRVYSWKFRGFLRRTRLFSPIPHVVCLSLLLLFVFAQWRSRTYLKIKLSAITETLIIYGQMKDYSTEVCRKSTAGTKSFDQSRISDIKYDNSSKNVQQDVTLILVSYPYFSCAESVVRQFRKKYPSIKVVLSFQTVGNGNFNMNASNYYSLLKTVMYLGEFGSYAEALQSSIAVVKTKYFMVVDSELAVDKMQDNFLETITSYMEGFDIIGGSIVDNRNEFNIPCYSLRLKNWTFFEKYEYNITNELLLCESTSQYFVGNTGTISSFLMKKPINSNLGVLWLHDFFLNAKGDLLIATLPKVIFKKESAMSCPFLNLRQFKRKQNVNDYLPFVNKHHVFHIIKHDGEHYSVCHGSDPLICTEKYVFPMWKLRHWAYSGLTAYPFIIERLTNALHYGTTQLEKRRLSYVLEGGTLLGFIKVRAVLPWDSGDVDTFVHSNRRPIIDLVKNIASKDHYEYLVRWNTAHVYVTPLKVARDGLIVYSVVRRHPGKLVKVKIRGKLFSAPRSMFKFIREFYGSSYLENRNRFGNERVSCGYAGHHACMPDCRWNGCGSGRGQFPGILS